jgi:hypothetical protein
VKKEHNAGLRNGERQRAMNHSTPNGCGNIIAFSVFILVLLLFF